MAAKVHEKNAGVLDASASDSVESIEAQGFDEARTKKLVRKLDWHLIPFLSLIYLYGPPSPVIHRNC
jgi:hypothetical protein